MIKRKLIVVLLTSIFLDVLFVLFFSSYSKDMIINFAYLFLYILPFVLFYGAPVSILSDYLAEKFRFNLLLSFFLHILFAFLFIIINVRLMMISIIAAIIYFVLDKLWCKLKPL